MGPNNFQSSFIPKFDGTFESDGGNKKTSILSVIISTISIGIILTTLGLFVYSKMLKNSINDSKQKLTLMESSLDKKSIEQMVLFSKKLSFSKDLVNKHKVISNFLSLLSKNTVQTVYFNDLSYDLSSGGLRVLMSGLSIDYGSLALQQKIISDLKEVKSLDIGDLYVDEKGRVVFKLEIFLDPNSAIYMYGVENPDIKNESSASKSAGKNQPTSDEDVDIGIDGLNELDNFNL